MSDPESKKFMFDLHSFDAPEEEEEDEDLEPPPPSFSEEELAAAKDASFKEGHAQALEESKNAREQYIAEQLNQILRSYNEIYQNEIAREALFEKEVVSLSRVIFERCFPVLSEQFGKQEVERIIREAFDKNEGASEIEVRIRPDELDEISTLMESMNPRPEHLKCIADETLPAGGVKMKWKDGGAIRDPIEMGEKIATILSDTLASTEGSDQNENEENGDNTP